MLAAAGFGCKRRKKLKANVAAVAERGLSANATADGQPG